MDREELAQQIIDRLYSANVSLVADNAGLNVSTLYHWMSGHIINPRLPSLIAVGRALGMELTWKNTRRMRRAA